MYVPYSGKFSRDKIFADFTVGLTSAKILSANFHFWSHLRKFCPSRSTDLYVLIKQIRLCTHVFSIVKTLQDQLTVPEILWYRVSV